MISINTNVGAMLALRTLAQTQSELAEVQTRISTGRKINSAKDNPATWAIAQNMRGRILALDSVKESLARGQSTVDVALSAGEQVSDLLTQMKQKVLAASDTTLDATSRASMNEDFKALRDQIARTVSNASFNGVNLLDAGSTGFAALANDNGTARLTVQGTSLAFGGAYITLSATASFGSAASASALIGVLNSSITGVSSALTRLGTGSRSLETHATFIDKLQDTLEAGVGNLVDADIAKESARLQALQVKLQLGIQALSIANATPSILLQLFRQN